MERESLRYEVKTFCLPHLAPSSSPFSLWTEIKAHNVRAVSFVLFGDVLRTIAQETASQMGLRNCSEPVRGEVSTYMILEKGMQSSTHLGRRLLLVMSRYFS